MPSGAGGGSTARTVRTRERGLTRLEAMRSALALLSFNRQSTATAPKLEVDFHQLLSLDTPPEVMQQGVAAARAYFDSKLDAAGSVYA